MGTFTLYFIPGIVCAIFGLRWTYCSFRRYFLCRRELVSLNARSRLFRSSITFPVSCCPSVPMEAAAMLAFVTIASIGELVAAIRLGFMLNSMNLTVYSFYGMGATVMLLKHFGLPVVPDVDYACFIVSFLVTIYAVQRNIAGMSTFEAQVHQNEMLVMFALTVVMALEMKYRHNPLLPLIRAVCLTLNGSWLLMMAYILHWPWGAWAHEDPKSIMMATISFVGHIASNLQLAGLIGGVAMARVKSLSPGEVSVALDREGLGQRRDTEYRIVSKSEPMERSLLNSDDEV